MRRRTFPGRWGAALALALAAAAGPARAQLQPVVPDSLRGRVDAERWGTHEAANIRTRFWNYGMVGDYPPDPGNVDLSTFHSAEVPKGSGMNYSDGITPFVLAKVRDGAGDDAYIMETGFRERQTLSPYKNRVMRFEPRPGYFEDNLALNPGNSPAISTDPRTWPSEWPDKRLDPDDPGWAGSWNGYFGKRAAADQESFTVLDDQFYDAWDYYPDSRDPTRRGLGLRIEVRGFQWSNPQAGNVIFWHYDITNESTTDYDDNIIFGLYMDSGVGGSALSCDGIYESDDDNAFWDRSAGLNLVYTWDKFGRGKDLAGNCSRTGYLGYAYLETPGNAFDDTDNDRDGITDENRDPDAGQLIVGADAIRAYVVTHYDTTDFIRAYGSIEGRPAYRAGRWWTGDENLNWSAEFDDVGADGVKETQDLGEGDLIPTQGEPNFGKTDLNESDQIGLTGFKMNRIKAGAGNPDPRVDDIVFYRSSTRDWPLELYQKFTDPNPAARFDSALAANYNIGFLFASGTFVLKAGQRERFSLALAYGADLTDLREQVRTVQLIYNANYQFAVPPPMPTLTAEAGDGRVRLSWDDAAEKGFDPVTNLNDFEGYRIYRSTDPEFRDPKIITTGKGNPFPGNGKPIAQFDLVDGKRGYSKKTIDGVAYWLGEDTGITHTWVDSTVVNGQRYYYAICSYDYGFQGASDSLSIYPSESSIAVSRTPRGEAILPINVVEVRPEPQVKGFTRATADSARHVAGPANGDIDVGVEVVNSGLVPDGHLFVIGFDTPSPDSIVATSYYLRDSTTRTTLFSAGHDLDGLGIGPTGSGLMPVIYTQKMVTVDTAGTGWTATSPVQTPLEVSYLPGRSVNYRRPGYPDDFEVEFSDTVQDTGLALPPVPARPAKFKVYALTDTGRTELDFRFQDRDGDGTLSRTDEYIDVVTYYTKPVTTNDITWRVRPQGPVSPPQAVPKPAAGNDWITRLFLPLTAADLYTFGTTGQHVDPQAEAVSFAIEKPYVVPNPYVGSASFEPAPYAVSGRGERRVEFRAIPLNATIRIYTVSGELVQTLRQDGSTQAYVPWNLRNHDQLDVAPGLYVFQVDAPDAGTYLGKFALIK